MSSFAYTPRSAAGFLLALMCGLAPMLATAQADKSAEKAARRFQLQIQNLQQQLQEAQSAKSQLETDKAGVDKVLLEQAPQLAQMKAALRQAGDNAKLAEAARLQLAAQVTSLERQMTEQRRSHDDALAQKARELVQFTRLRDDQQAQWQRRHDEQVVLVGECATKNDQLTHLSLELIDRYRHKTVADVIKQREPLLGLGDIQMFNFVQDQRDKVDVQRFTAPHVAAPSPSLPPSINR